MKYISIFLTAIFLSGCSKYYVNITKVTIDKNSIASTFARTPDPLKVQPPSGEKLYITWRLSTKMDPTHHKIVLHVIYKDLTEETITYPLTVRAGTFDFQLLNEKFEKAKGFYSYKAELIDAAGEILDTWQHIMWVKVL